MTMQASQDSGSMQRRVHAMLKSMIADGRIQPGERLLEVKVAGAFNVSRSPARATLQALCRERLVRKAQGRGYLVSGAAPAASLGRLATLDAVTIQPAPLWERVYAEVELHLATHILFRSVRLTEEKLADHYGVSRTVARDVLARMHSVGLVGKDKLGRWIAEQVTPSRILHLYELRWLLEPAALMQAAPLIGRQRLVVARDALAETLGHMRCADSPEMDRLEQDLHVQLMNACPNREIVRALGPTRLLLVLNRYMFDLYIGVPTEVLTGSLREHLRVIDCLLDRDWAGAGKALEAHLRASCEHWQNRYRQVSRERREPRVEPYLSLIEAADEASGQQPTGPRDERTGAPAAV